jgi:xylulokinase
MTDVVLGVDIGTSSSKGVLVDSAGRVIRSHSIAHEVQRPRPGWVEMDGRIWWREFVEIVRALLTGEETVVAVGVSGMGPCVLVTDAHGEPLRPAILYGVDTRATEEIEAQNRRFGADAIHERCGSALSTQAVGPKLEWIRNHEPDVSSRMRRLFMPASWLAYQLTGAYVLDHHSASQSVPLYDDGAGAWHAGWSGDIAPNLELPDLKWPGDIAGTVSTAAATATGIPKGTPVIAGTIDAWSEAVSVDAQNSGDLMLMYGTTMFLVHTVPQRLTSSTLWGTVGAYAGTRNLAGGMATSGAVTSWLKELFGGADYPELLSEAEASGPGARGLLMLPYFAGERTPIADPEARGIIAGLTISHNRGDLYRAALEATALGVRHNIEEMEAAGGNIQRVVAVGGGTQGGLWAQIVSDITGRAQVIPEKTIGASYGAAYLAARTVGDVDIAAWNPPSSVIEPDAALSADYQELYDLYLQLYPATSAITHTLAGRQQRRLASS